MKSLIPYVEWLISFVLLLAVVSLVYFIVETVVGPRGLDLMTNIEFENKVDIQLDNMATIIDDLNSKNKRLTTKLDYYVNKGDMSVEIQGMILSIIHNMMGNQAIFAAELKLNLKELGLLNVDPDDAFDKPVVDGILDLIPEEAPALNIDEFEQGSFSSFRSHSHLSF